MKISYGVTTVPERCSALDNTLELTLRCLNNAGFPNPVLFVDGLDVVQIGLTNKYDSTFRTRRLGAFGNWVLGLQELYIREPIAELYILFQDDIQVVPHLREYIEATFEHWPNKGYFNFFNTPENEHTDSIGWYPSKQTGRGALALGFTQTALQHVLNAPAIVTHPTHPVKGKRAIDGTVLSAMKYQNFKEYVHAPSLVKHTGERSVISNNNDRHPAKHPNSSTFPGLDFDARTLIKVPHVHEESSKRNRIGLVGYNCQLGLGEMNRAMVENMDIDHWLIKIHPKYKTFPKPDNVDVTACGTGEPHKIERFLQSVDTVLYAETPYFRDLVPMAKSMGKRTVCIPMLEWFPGAEDEWVKGTDLFLCPTQHSFNALRNVVNCLYYPWPIDTDKYKFKQRDKAERFIYIGGNGGYHGRKGRDVIDKCKQQSWFAERLIDFDWSNGYVNNNEDLYKGGDVLLVPHMADGLGLTPLEAASCGIPCISTDGEPWNEYPSIAKIRASVSKKQFRNTVRFYEPDPNDLLEVCKQLLGCHPGVVHSMSKNVRDWAEERSWKVHKNVYAEIVRTGAKKVALPY